MSYLYVIGLGSALAIFIALAGWGAVEHARADDLAAQLQAAKIANDGCVAANLSNQAAIRRLSQSLHTATIAQATEDRARRVAIIAEKKQRAALVAQVVRAEKAAAAVPAVAAPPDVRAALCILGRCPS